MCTVFYYFCTHIGFLSYFFAQKLILNSIVLFNFNKQGTKVVIQLATVTILSYCFPVLQFYFPIFV